MSRVHVVYRPSPVARRPSPVARRPSPVARVVPVGRAVDLLGPQTPTSDRGEGHLALRAHGLAALRSEVHPGPRSHGVRKCPALVA